jgi:hypothetical protein
MSVCNERRLDTVDGHYKRALRSHTNFFDVPTSHYWISLSILDKKAQTA